MGNERIGVVPSFDRIMSITGPISDSSHLTEEEARALYDCLRILPIRATVVEVGCQLGRSSSVIAQVKAALSLRTIHIDPFLAIEWAQKWIAMMMEVDANWNHAFTLLCMRTEAADWQLERLCRDGIDLAFIDGDHSYRGVAIDMEKVADRVSTGGLLLCHDYLQTSLPEVRQAIDDYLAIKPEAWKKLGTYGTLGAWKRNQSQI